MLQPGETSGSVLPIAWRAAHVCNRHDIDVVFTHAVDEPVGKSSEAPGARSASDSSDLRAGADQLDRVRDGIEELTTKTGPLLLVPANGLGELGRRRVADLKGASPPENVLLDAAPHFLPRLEWHGAGLNCVDSPFDLGTPRGLGVGICRAVEACEQFRGQFSTNVWRQAESVGKECFGGLGHASNLTPGEDA